MVRCLALVALVAAVGISTVSTAGSEEAIQRLEKRLVKLEQEHKAYQNVISALSRQISMQQFYVEEMTRSSGGSGIKAARLTHTGTRSYHTTSYSDKKVAAIHDHSNTMRTLGMGELIVVLNGVEFRTRHNDYKLVMPHRNSTAYGATEDIPFPDVPPEVLAQPTVEMQADEMKQWFKAFKDQDYSKRDYRKYFKPVLCYMEGMWTAADNKIHEPFQSDRHFLEAESFFDLQEKAVFSSGTGRKSIGENYAFLPTKVSKVSSNGLPVYSQWNYDILCHPLKQDVPLDRLRLEDDLGIRVARQKTYEQAAKERIARFSLWPEVSGTDQFRKTKEGYIGLTMGSFLDSLMAEIPGKDNYRGYKVDNAFNETAIATDYREPYTKPGQRKPRPPPMNTAFYHRLYRTNRRDAMGSEIRHRSFSDATLYIAYNTRPTITPFEVNWCKKDKRCSPYKQKNGQCQMKTCSQWADRVSFAIPLELVYLNPLQSWNPYDIQFHQHDDTPQKFNATSGNRNGEPTEEKAIYGSSNKWYYRTPYSFFDGDDERPFDTADTTKATMSVLDQKGVIRKTRASGIHIMTPNIPGVGVVRQRYPIMPVHQAGSYVFKELDALKDVTLKAGKYRKFYRDKFENDNGTLEEVFEFEIAMGDKNGTGPHYHTVDITTSQLIDMKAGIPQTVLTSSAAGHDHEITLQYRVAKYANNKTVEHLFITECDGQGWSCWDGHKGWSICNECPDGFPDV